MLVREIYDVRDDFVLSFQYNSAVNESTIVPELLRIQVEDKDTPNTPAWQAKYTIIKGNEHGNYEIKTDPKTNEGILSIIKVILRS